MCWKSITFALRSVNLKNLHRAYCYAELAVSFIAVAETIASTHCAYPCTEGWPVSHAPDKVCLPLPYADKLVNNRENFIVRYCRFKKLPLLSCYILAAPSSLYFKLCYLSDGIRAGESCEDIVGNSRREEAAFVSHLTTVWHRAAKRRQTNVLLSTSNAADRARRR